MLSNNNCTIQIPGTTLDNQAIMLGPAFGQPIKQEFSLDTNNLGQIQQHNMQGAQQYSPAQPGFDLARQDFVMARPQHQQQQHGPQIMQMIQQQMARQAFISSNQLMDNRSSHDEVFESQYVTGPQLSAADLSVMSAQRQPMQMNTPHHMQSLTTPRLSFLPSPPPTHKSGVRLVRNVDAKPITLDFNGVASPYVNTQDVRLYTDAADSAYGMPESCHSSAIDPTSPQMSPSRQAMQSMTLQSAFEDCSSMPSPELLAHQHHMMMASAMNPGFHYHGMPIRAPLSPREAMLASLELDATIEDTGISAEEVAAYISEQDPLDSKWTCMFPECGKKFGRKENIRSHVQTHLGDRQFRCNHCGKCFVRQHDLKRHAKIHSGDKPHKCPCGNGFARQDALTRHRQRGVCCGALPGFQRKEVKRGRPRKHRPDLNDRLDKASRARNADARRVSDDEEYTSSSSAFEVASSYGDPRTPSQHSDLNDSDNFADLATSEGVEAFINACRSSSPSASHDASPGQLEMTFGDMLSTDSNTLLQTSQFYDLPTALTSVSPSYIQSAQSPALDPSTIHQTPVQNTRAARTSPSQADTCLNLETSPTSMFDWAVIGPQPSLINDGDPFSPGPSSSASESDVFGDDHDNDYLVNFSACRGANELYGLPRSSSSNGLRKSILDQMQPCEIDNLFDIDNSLSVEGWLAGH